MARDTSPQCKQCRREGQKLFLKGERCLTEKCGVERRSYPPGEHGRGRVRASEYRNQLREKQKARRFYGVLEKQFRGYYEKASRQEGVTGENLLRLLELRMDNVVCRLGVAASLRESRQMVAPDGGAMNVISTPGYDRLPEPPGYYEQRRKSQGNKKGRSRVPRPAELLDLNDEDFVRATQGSRWRRIWEQ